MKKLSKTEILKSKLILNILKCGNIKKACDIVNVSRSTYYRWYKQGSFQNKLNDLLKITEDKVLKNIVLLADKIPDRLINLLDDPDKSISLKTCRTILAAFMKMNEHETMLRINNMERMIKENDQNNNVK